MKKSAKSIRLQEQEQDPKTWSFNKSAALAPFTGIRLGSGGTAGSGSLWPGVLKYTDDQGRIAG